MSDNQYGPFTDALTGPLTPKTQAPAIRYAPSRAGALAMFANQFIKGAQAGERTKYERSEQMKAEKEHHMDQYFAYSQNDPTLSTEGKQAIEKAYMQAKYGQVQEHLGKSKDKDNPMMNLMRSITGAVVGPSENKNHRDFDVNNLMSIANDPKYKIDPAKMGADALEQASGNLGGQQPKPFVGPQQQQVQAPQQQQGAAPIAQPVGPQQQAVPKPPTPTPPPPGTVAAGSIGKTQEEAWQNPNFVAAVNKLTKAGIDWHKTPLGENFATLPKAGTVKPIGAPYTVTENGKQITKRDYLDATTGTVSSVVLGDAKSGAGSRPVLGSSRVTLSDAKELSKKGATYNVFDDAGQHIKLEDIPEGMQLQPVLDSVKGTYYKPVTPSQVLTIVGNEVYTSTSQDRGKIATPGAQGPTDLGVKNPGTNTTHEVPVMVNGVPTAMEMRGGSTPRTVGAKGAANAPRQAAPVAPAAPGSPAATPAAPGQTAPTSKPPATTAGTRPLPGVPTATWEKEQPKILTVKEASAPLFGSTDDPNLKGLADFGGLLENPKAITPLKTALQYTFDQLDKNSSHSSGTGFADWMSNSAGWTASKAEAEANVRKNIFDQIQDPALKDEVMQAYNATMTAFGTAVGLRKLTGASAAKFSVKAIENELPVLGVNTFNEHDLYDRLSRLAVQVKNGAASTIDTAWNAKGERDKYLNYDKLMQERKSQSPDPAVKQITNKAGHTINIGDTVTSSDGKSHVVRGFTSKKEIVTK